MNLQQTNINTLATMWTVSSGNPELKLLIEAELANRILVNNSFSKEYLFDINKIKGHALGIFFIPTSNAYNTFGNYVTVDYLIDAEKEVLMKNYINKPPINSYGNIKAKALVTDNLSQEQIDLLVQKGFDTNEILSVQHY